MTPGLHRARALAALLAVVGLGLVSRRVPLGFWLWDKALGDALYAAMVYLVLALFRPGTAPGWLAGISLAVCIAIEAFQATGIPRQYAGFPPVRWLLGTTFGWHDMMCYPVGVALVLCADILWLRVEPANRRKMKQDPNLDHCNLS